MEGERKTLSAMCLCHMTPPLCSTVPFLPSCLLPHSFPPSAHRQGWIPTFISTIQPQCLLATELRSFNCPYFLCFIHPVVAYSTVQLPVFTFSVLLLIPLRPWNCPVWLDVGAVFFIFFCVVLVSLVWSTQTISVPHLRQTDRQERLFCQDVSLQLPAGAQNTHTRRHTINGGRLGPQSERPSQNQLAFKLMKRVMKRALSLLQKADRQAESWLWICIRKTHWKEHQRYSNSHFVPYFSEGKVPN